MTTQDDVDALKAASNDAQNRAVEANAKYRAARDALLIETYRANGIEVGDLVQAGKDRAYFVGAGNGGRGDFKKALKSGGISAVRFYPSWGITPTKVQQ